MSTPAARNLLLACIAVAMLWTFPYLAPLNNPNENVRLYMTMAIVDHGSFAIGRRDLRPGGRTHDHGSIYDRFGYVNDKAITCDDPAAEGPRCAGTLYAAKAPGTSYLGVPAYALVKTISSAADAEPSKEVLLFWLRLFVVILPALLFLWAFARHLEQRIVSPFVRHATLLALGAGSLFFSYATTYAGHTLSAACLGGAWLALAATERARMPMAATFVAGFLAAYSVVAEYPSALGAVLLFAWLLLRGGALPRGRWRLAGAFVAGAIVPAGLLALYHQVCFGAPWRTAYSTLENTQFVADIAPGFMGIQAPSLEAFAGSFFAPYNGLFFFAPWTVLLVAALVSAIVWQIRRRRGGAPPGGQLLFPLLVTLVYGLFISSHSLWRGGWTVGPRYIVMAVPFMALAVAHAADRWMHRAPRLSGVAFAALTLASVAIAVGVAQVSQGFPPEFYSPIFEFAWPMLRDGYVYQNAGNVLGLHGLWSLVPLALVMVLGAALVLRSSARKANLPALLSVACAFLVLSALAESSAKPWSARKAKGLAWQRRVWQVPDQSPDQRRLLELDSRTRHVGTGALSPEEHSDRVRLTASRGELDRAWRFVVPTR